jgi:HEAT repeat protein
VADPDEWLLREAGMKVDGDSLLEFLRKQSNADHALRHLDQLIQQLGSNSFHERKEASTSILNLGYAALPSLVQAMNHPDAEISRRAKICVEQIRENSLWTLASSVIRRLSYLRPMGTEKAIINYLPYAPDPCVQEEIYFTVNDLTESANKIDPALISALEDVFPSRRALAACIVGRLGTVRERVLVRRLLQDRDPLVRLRSAQGLLAARDKSILPILIGLLDEQDISIAWQAEELLHYVAGEDSPERIVGEGTQSLRKQCQKAWQMWLTDHADKLDLACLNQQPRRPGFVLLTSSTFRSAKNEPVVWIAGCDGKRRWRLMGQDETYEAHLLPGNRVLISDTVGPVEESLCRLSERDLAGNILWQYKSPLLPIRGYRRLPDGRTLISASSRIPSELTADRRLIGFSDRSTLLDNPDRASAVDIELLHGNKLMLRLVDRVTQKTISTRIVHDELPPILQSQVLPGGNILFISGSKPYANKILMLDRSCKPLYQLQLRVHGCRWFTRLHNGNYLAFSALPLKRVVEIDQAGKTVWEMLLDKDVNQPQLCLELVRLGFAPRSSGEVDLDAPESRLRALREPNVIVRRAATIFLRQEGSKLIPLIANLMPGLEDPDEDVKLGIVGVLGAIGPDAIPSLEKASAHRDWHVREESIRVLTRYPEDKRVIPVLTAGLSDPVKEVRVTSAYMIARLAGKAKDAVPTLIDCVRTNQGKGRDDLTFREAAVVALEAIGADARSATTALLSTLADAPEELRPSVARALGRINASDERVLGALLSALKNTTNTKLRCFAVEGLGAMGKRGKPAVPHLVAALRQQDSSWSPDASSLHQSILLTLAELGPHSADAFPALLELIRDKKAATKNRTMAIDALRRIGTSSESIIRELRAAEGDSDPHVSSAAAQALRTMLGPN